MATIERHIWMVRHGYRADVADPAWVLTAARPWDCGLAAEGAVQARETGIRLARENVHHVFSSPLLRAVETAHHIAEALDLPVKIEDGLSEALYEKWFPVNPDFPSAADLAARFPRVDKTYSPACSPSYPEDPEGMLRRTERLVRALVRDFAGNLLFVGHGGSFGGLARALVGDSAGIRTPYCCLISFVERAGCWTLQQDGSDRSHLSCPDPGVDAFRGAGAARP